MVTDMTNPTTDRIVFDILNVLTAEQERDRMRARIGDIVLVRAVVRDGKRIDKRDAAAIEAALNGGKAHDERRAEAGPDVYLPGWRCVMVAGSGHGSFGTGKELEFWHSGPDHEFKYNNRFGIKLPRDDKWSAGALELLNPYQYGTLPADIARRALALYDNDAVPGLARKVLALRDATAALEACIGDDHDSAPFGQDRCALKRALGL